MKVVLAAVLLLLQLQPVLGTVACLELSKPATQQDCRMPEHGQSSTPAFTAFDVATSSCELATICTPAPLAVPGFSASLETAVPLFEAAGPLAATLPLGISPAPPFHPPRA
jgi:hypothetical protein